jgi:hypothetical protein
MAIRYNSSTCVCRQSASAPRRQRDASHGPVRRSGRAPTGPGQCCFKLEKITCPFDRDQDTLTVRESGESASCHMCRRPPADPFPQDGFRAPSVDPGAANRRAHAAASENRQSMDPRHGVGRSPGELVDRMGMDVTKIATYYKVVGHSPVNVMARLARHGPAFRCLRRAPRCSEAARAGRAAWQPLPGDEHLTLNSGIKAWLVAQVLSVPPATLRPWLRLLLRADHRRATRRSRQPHGRSPRRWTGTASWRPGFALCGTACGRPAVATGRRCSSPSRTTSSDPS